MNSKKIFGFLRPENDIHTLGLSTVTSLLEEIGYTVHIADSHIVKSVLDIKKLESRSLLKKWIIDLDIQQIGFSYRLEPKDAQNLFGRFFNFLESENLLKRKGGPIENVFFAGLPLACKLIDKEYNGEVKTFMGDETPLETLSKLGASPSKIKNEFTQGAKYDNFRLDFAKEFLQTGKYQFYKPLQSLTYKNYGTRNDTLEERLFYHREVSNLPLIRVHVGPYNEDRREAIKLFKHWLKVLSETRYLDIVSVGSSQLSQSNFGENWEGKQNGGGVPVNSELELVELYEAGRPMLMRIYSATNKTQVLAHTYEKTINISWH